MENKNSFFLAIILCLSLGLAPFTPEPHLWGKILWISGGAIGMSTIDWLDFFFHLSPWLYLTYISVKYFLNSPSQK
jgi:hypothetical protein